jgi:hypothetical protein
MEPKYQAPKDVPVPKGNGYPNNVKNTQTVETRGTGKAQRGDRSSKRLA